jgi:methionine-rich copper-binding protein CopC
MTRPAVFVLLLLVPAVLYAHVYLRGTDPENGAVLDSCPGKVTMTFVGSLEPAFSKIEVFDQEGNKVSKKTTFRESDSVMEVELQEDLKPGEYTAEWLCVSLDGHKQKGSFAFIIK